MTNFFYFLVFWLHTPLALAGNELGNGGDKFAQEFVATGRALTEDLRKTPDSRIPDIDSFEKAVDATRVVTKDELVLEGHEVDAKNFPEQKLIELNRARWREYDRDERKALVLHEYLGVCCSGDRNYEISSSYSDGSNELFRARLGTEAQLRTGYSGRYTNGLSADRPSVGGSVGYQLSRRSTLGLSADSHRFMHEVNRTDSESLDFKRTTNLLELHLFYKYWLLEFGKLRPYFNVGLGYARSAHSDVYRLGNWAYDQEHDFDYHHVAAKLSLGLSYRLSRTVGLDLSLNAHGLYRTKWNKRETGFYDGQLGLSFFL